ncbi:putative FAD dependent oxidoreductase [Atractiella rhizophila]|nr:putative FAD dependent oxidoreductase [Atractiella rhizophila]
MLSPKNATELSLVIQQLGKTEEQFAFKSGGHSPNQYFASTDGGILVSLRNMDEVTYDPSTGTARVGPGNRWEEVHKKILDTGYGRTVVGGRIGHVGVGGLALGGGLSFMSSEHGWVANNVVDYEVVLGNGTIVHANQDQNQDLFKALKGGGSNFGIVSTYTLQTYEQGNVWGGNLAFSAEQTPALLAAVRDFTDNYPDDKAAIILTVERGALLDTWIMFLYYNGPEPPTSVFAAFFNIDHISDTTKTQTYYELLKGNDLFVLHGFRYNIGTETIPLPNATYGTYFMQQVHDIWKNTTESMFNIPNLLGSMAFQPMPPAIVNKALDKGGDMISFERDSKQIVIELDFSYSGEKFDDQANAGLTTITKSIRELVTTEQAAGNIPNSFTPLFMNDALFSQDYWGRNKNLDFARDVKAVYDPDNFFSPARTGGFFFTPHYNREEEE